jgi:hypothetical protein
MDVNLEEIRPAPDLSVVSADHRGDRVFPLTEMLPAVEQFRRRLSLLRYGHLDDPGTRRAQDALTVLWATRGVDALLPRLLERALHLNGADRGNVQLADPDTGALRIAAQVGFQREFLRAVQSTPLVDRSGMLVGMVSTHHPHAGRPSDDDLRVLRSYGRLAGEALSQLLGSPKEASADGFEAILPVLAELDHSLRDLQSGATEMLRR